MGLFRHCRRSLVPAAVIGALAEYGAAVLESRSGSPINPRFGWYYVGPVVTAIGGPACDRVNQELYEAAHAASSQPLTAIGAYNLMCEGNAPATDTRFLELRDASLDYMRQNGYSSGHLTRDEADRWIEIHGDLRSSFDSIIDVAVPSPDKCPGSHGLEPRRERLIALTAPLPEGNAFYAERREEGKYIVFSEHPRSSDDPSRTRSDESHLGAFTSMADLLRAVGKMFGTKPYWADEDLGPYFPSRRG